MSMNDTYEPISCAFYDELESAAVKKLQCEIVYLEGDEKRTISTKIVDFKTIEKQEFMVLENKKIIRLDKIIAFNSISKENRQYC